jgi:hypothetical protein
MGITIKKEAKHAVQTKTFSAPGTHMSVLLMRGSMIDNSCEHQGFNPRRYL